MALYFNYKTPFNTLGSKFTKRIEADSILNWFQEIWRLDLNEEELNNHYIEKFGTHFYGIGHLAYNVIENQVQKPKSVEELINTLKENSYINEINIENEKYLEVLTDDDEFSLAWYLIEEEYAKKDLKRFSYLMHEDWKLPLNFSDSKIVSLDFEFKNIIDPIEKRNGELYFISVCNDAGDGPIEYYPTKIQGIRLPDLKEYLVDEKFNFEKLPVELIYYMVKLKEQKELQNAPLLNQIKGFQDSIPELHKLFHFYIDLDSEKLCLGFKEAQKEFKKAFGLLSERDKKLKEMGRRDLSQIGEIQTNGNDHFIQIAIQADYWEDHPVDSDVKESKVYDQIFMFDDLWVNENYHLANSMINYYTNWKL